MTVFGHILFEVATGRVAVQNKRVFVALGSITAAALLLLPVDAHYFRSMVVYKLVLLWTTVILGYRFYLFMKHVVRVTSEPPALLTAAQGPDRRDALTAPGPAGEIKSSAR
jgi:hypothetical protein